MTSKEQKRPPDIFEDALDYLWNGLGLEGNGWKRLKKGDFKKKMKNGLTYQIWFDRSHYNYIDYEIGHGNVEVGFSCIIKQGDDYLYSFRIEPTTGGSFFRMLTEDLRWTPGCWTPSCPWSKPTTSTSSTALRQTPWRHYSRSAPLSPRRRTTVGSSVCGSRWWNGTERRSRWRSTAVRQNCAERRSARRRPIPESCCSTSPMPRMWIMPGPQAAPKRNWTRWWNLCAGQAADRTVDAGG